MGRETAVAAVGREVLSPRTSPRGWGRWENPPPHPSLLLSLWLFPRSLAGAGRSSFEASPTTATARKAVAASGREGNGERGKFIFEHGEKGKGDSYVHWGFKKRLP